jgi:hypothetical protein
VLIVVKDDALPANHILQPILEPTTGRWNGLGNTPNCHFT